MNTSTPRVRNGAYQLFMLVLCLLALGILAGQTLTPVSPSTYHLLQYADTAICAVFFADFLWQLARAPDRWAYFIRWGWIDLLSSVPMVDAARVGRLARVLRILRILRGVRSAKLVADFILARRSESAFLAASLVSLLLTLFASIAILQFERVPEANIKTAGDALWWSITTLTTVGYGDRFPVTPEGRMVASLLMVAGVGLFGILSGFVASWFIKPVETEQENELELIRRELAEMKALLAARG